MDDGTLVGEAAAGSREAFDELVTKYRGQIYGVVRTLTRDDPDAEDLVQETFVRAYRAIARFRQDSAFRTWLYRIAVNVARTHLDRRRRRTSSLDVGADGEQVVAEALIVREDLELALARRQAIVDALAVLPEDWRIALTLRDMQGLEYHEIASVMNVPIGTIESRVFRARRRVRPLLESWMRTRSSKPDTGSELVSAHSPAPGSGPFGD